MTKVKLGLDLEGIMMYICILFILYFYDKSYEIMKKDELWVSRYIDIWDNKKS